MNKLISLTALLLFPFSLGFATNLGGNNSGGGNGCSSPNPPSNCCGSGSGNTSFGYRVPFGGVPFEEGLSAAAFKVRKVKPSPLIFTTQLFYYASPIASQLSVRDISGSSWNISVVGENTERVNYKISSGQSVGIPTGIHSNLDSRILIVDENEALITAGSGNPAPAYVVVLNADSSELTLDYSTSLAVKYESPTGRVTDFASIPEAQQTEVILEEFIPRQVKAAQGLADLVQVEDQKFEFRFYTYENIGTKNSEGLYEPIGVPYRTITFENATNDPNDFEHVKITENWGTRTWVDQFDYIDSVEEWALTQGGGLSSETKSSVSGPGTDETTYTRLLKDGNGAVVSKTVEVYKEFAWGEALLRKTQDPDDLNLSTVYQYYTNSSLTGSYSEVKNIQYPDGYWEAFSYDSKGRETKKITPWKDAPFNSAENEAKVMESLYVSHDLEDTVTDEDFRPRTEIEKVLGIVTGKTFYVYKTVNGEYIEIEERAGSNTAQYGDAGNMRTTKIYYGETDPVSSGRLKTIERPDGTLTTYTYSRNESDLDNYFVETVTEGTVASPIGVEAKTTRTVKTYDHQGNKVQEEHYIYVNGTHVLVSTKNQVYDDQLFLIGGTSDGRTTYSAFYDGGLLASGINEQGIETVFTYDALRRVETETKLGVAAGTYPAQEDIVMTYNRVLGEIDCGCDGETIITRTAGTLSLSRVEKKDKLGRSNEVTDEAGYITTLSYSEGGRITTRTEPSTATVITENYLDRRVKSITGTGVVAEYYDYGVNADGSKWEDTRLSAANSPRYRKMTYDVLERLVELEQPAFTSGDVLLSSYSYDERNLLVAQSQTGLADTRYEYDSLARLVRRGLDIDGNGTLDLASADRIFDTETLFESYENNWWSVTETSVYATINNAATTQISELRRRLSGLGGVSGLKAESVTTDIHGNAMRSRDEIDYAGKTMTRTVDWPDSTLDAVSIWYNGLLQSESTKTVSTPTTYLYDALARRVGVDDPRHANNATMAYDLTTGQLISQTDAAGNTTSFEYYANGEVGASQLKVQTDALGQKSYLAYNLRDEQIRTWGETDYPVEYGYNAYTELTSLKTYRAGTDWEQSTWPAAMTGVADETVWTYHEATGLLSRKEYADGKGTDYAYDSANRLATRTWARGLTTTYGYDTTTGELLSVDYSDTTPDIAYTYDRLGRQSSVTDVIGLRTFAYNAQLQLESETVASFYGTDKLLTRKYDTVTLPGRSTGFEIGEASDTDADYSVTYGYSSVGRLNQVTDSNDTFTYTYLTNSDLLSGLTTTNGDLSISYGYEVNRDLKTIVNNDWNISNFSNYTYQYDAIGRSLNVTNSGSAFAQSAYNRYEYNNRSEVISCKRYLGQDPANYLVDPEVLNERVDYDFDNAGNRNSASRGDAIPTSYSANQLNQYDSIGGVSLAFDDDGNTQFDGEWYNVWNGENRLIQAKNFDVVPVNGSLNLTFKYDYLGRRVQKIVESYDGAVWSTLSDEKYFYDGWNLTTVSNALLGNSLAKTYTWGLDLSQTLHDAGGVGGLLSCKEFYGTHQGMYYFSCDAGGNISQVIDSVGNIDAHYLYDLFGNQVVAGSYGVYKNVNIFGFSSKYFDVETNLHYYGYRYYSSELGRWLNRDPIEEYGNQLITSPSWLNPLELQLTFLYDYVHVELENVFRQFAISDSIEESEDLLKSYLNLYYRLNQIEDFYRAILIADYNRFHVSRSNLFRESLNSLMVAPKLEFETEISEIFETFEDVLSGASSEFFEFLDIAIADADALPDGAYVFVNNGGADWIDSEGLKKRKNQRKNAGKKINQKNPHRKNKRKSNRPKHQKGQSRPKGGARPGMNKPNFFIFPFILMPNPCLYDPTLPGCSSCSNGMPMA